MKLIIVLAVVAWSNAAKLDRTYLPPNAQASAGSGSFLQTPLSGPSSDYQTQAGFSRNRPAQRFPQSQQGFSQPQSGFSQPQSGFSQSQNGFSQPQSGLSQPQHGFEQSQNGFAQPQAYGQNQNGFENFESRPERPQAAFERNAAILRQDSQNDGETYSYAYETENGIYAEESGVASNGVEAQGGFSYTGDDGKVYSIRYTADQNGFVPQGDHLPTPPPIPEEILKALEQNARDEAAGIYDDGSYSEGKYSNDDSNQYGNGNNANNYNNGNNNYNNGNNAYNNGNNAYNNDNNAYNNDDDTIVTNSAAFRGAPDSGNFASQGAAGATKAYLPPLQNQRNGPSGRNAGRRPSFNARDGYRY